MMKREEVLGRHEKMGRHGEMGRGRDGESRDKRKAKELGKDFP